MSVLSEWRLFGIPVARKLASKPTGKLQEVAVSTEGKYQTAFGGSKLTYEKVRAILKDPVVKFANLVMSSPVSRVAKTVKGADPVQVDFVKRHLLDTDIVTDFLKKAVTARYYGFYVAEVRFVEADGMIVLKTFKGLPPERCSIVEDDMGSLEGIEYQQPTIESEKVMLNAADGKFVLVTNRWWESESNRYGISELEEAREWAFAKRFVKDQMMRWVEKQANPNLVCSYLPQAIGTVTPEGEITTENIGSRALSLAQSFRQGGCAAVPKDADGKKLFELEYLKSDDRMPVWDAAIRVLNLELFHSLLIPEKAVTEGSGTGTYSQAQVHAEFLYQLQEDMATSLLQPLNDYVIPKLLMWNFPKPDGTVRITHEGLRDADKELVKMVVTDLLAAAREGVPLTPDVITYVRQKTGVPIDARFVAKPQPAPATFTRPEKPRRFARGDTKLRRKLTEREQLLPGGERYFLSLKADWSEAEQDMLAELVRVLKQQETKFLADLDAALAQTSKTSQLKAIREIGLTQYAKFEQAVRAGLEKAAELGLTGLAKELKLPKVPDFTGDLVSFLKTQASSVTEGSLGRLLSQLRSAAVQGVNQELPLNEVAFRAKGLFEAFTDSRLFGDVVRQTSTALNYARSMAPQLGLEGEDMVVSMTRTSVLDDSTCPVCDHFDGMTISVDDPDYRRMMPPSQCLGGHLCRCLPLYNQQKMRPSLREVDYKPPPVGMQEEIWY
jgi:hypothetical protein